MTTVTSKLLPDGTLAPHIMITQQQIEETVSWDGLKAFGSFVLSHSTDGSIPDYKKMNLMEIPHLVPHIWVYDLRGDENRSKLLINFAGEEHHTLHGRYIMGQFEVDVFNGESYSDLIHAYKSAIDKVSTVYSMRYERYSIGTGRESLKSVETLFFPCSSDGKIINWGIGCVRYGINPHEGDNIFLHF